MLGLMNERTRRRRSPRRDELEGFRPAVLLALGLGLVTSSVAAGVLAVWLVSVCGGDTPTPQKLRAHLVEETKQRKSLARHVDALREKMVAFGFKEPIDSPDVLQLAKVLGVNPELGPNILPRDDAPPEEWRPYPAAWKDRRKTTYWGAVGLQSIRLLEESVADEEEYMRVVMGRWGLMV